MREKIPEPLFELARACRAPLYVVGGSVRDYLLGELSPSPDWDVCSPLPEDELLAAAAACGFTPKAVYRSTGTVKLKDGDGTGYEFTRFRSDKYVRGLHRPSEIVFTDDVAVDARRRDFRANAIYYDITGDRFVDPLGGTEDVRARVLKTVAPADKVFGEDGLRLMRLARIAAQTGFAPDEESLSGAKKHAALIRDVAPERVFAELNLLLHADEKRKDGTAVYRGLKLLEETGVLAQILPELALGAGMEQRKDFHDHDVLEHSLRSAGYAAPEVRLAALLHDVGKPFCMLRDGKYHGHPEEGARIAREILERFKAPTRLTEETVKLVALHMRDYNLEMRESKVRREIAENYELLPKLFAVKQADYSGCKDRLDQAPVVAKWQNVLRKMTEEGVPFSVKELAVNGRDVIEAGAEPPRAKELLKELLLFCAEDGGRNRRDVLLNRLRRIL